MLVTVWIFSYCVHVIFVLVFVDFQLLRECNVRFTMWSFRYCVNIMCVLLCGVCDTA